MKQKVAFFDIDGTVFRSSLVVELVEKLIDEGVFPAEAQDAYADQYKNWRDREGSYEEYIRAVVSTFMENIKGVHYGELADIGKIVIAQQSKHVYRYTRDLIKKLKTEGYFIVAISQSPKTILENFVWIMRLSPRQGVSAVLTKKVPHRCNKCRFFFIHLLILCSFLSQQAQQVAVPE